MANGRDDLQEPHDIDNRRRSPKVAGNIEAIMAALEVTVNLGFRRLDDNVERLRTDLHENVLRSNDRIAEVDRRLTAETAAQKAWIDGLIVKGVEANVEREKRFVAIETWQKVATVRLGMIMTGISAIWIMFAPTIRHFFGIPT